MHHSFSLMAILLSLFIISSCTLDEDKQLIKPRNLEQETHLSEDFSISAPEGILNEIKQEIVNSSILHEQYTSLTETYGDFFWNKATFQPAQESRSITCVPSEKDDQLTGMLLIFRHDNHMDFNFIDLSLVMQVIQNNESVDDFEFLATIFSLQNMMYSRYRYINPDLNRYINDYIEDNQIEVRNEVYAVDWYITITDPAGNVRYSYTETRWHVIKCSGGSGIYMGPIFTNNAGGPNGSVNFTPPTNKKNWKIRTLSVDDNEKEIEEDIVECLDYSICNDLFNHINNLSGNYIIDHCTNTSAKDLALEILTDLCDNNVGDNTDISIEGGSPTPNVICDIDKFDEMWEEAVASSDEEFNDFVEGLKDGFDCTGNFNTALDEIIAQSNCSMNGFTSAFNTYFGITETIDDQTISPVLCMGGQVDPSLFNVSPVQDGVHFSAGISDFRFQVVNILGQELTIHHPHIQLMVVADLSLCPEKTHAEIMANALNQAVNQFRALMSSRISLDELDSLTESFHAIVSAHLDELSKECSNEGTSTSVRAIDQIGDYEVACGTIFTGFNQNHINDCD